MKNMRIKIGYILFIGLFFSCSGVKKVTNTEVSVSGNSEVKVSVDNIDDRKKKEFEYMFVEALKQKVFGDTVSKLTQIHRLQCLSWLIFMRQTTIIPVLRFCSKKPFH
jgi:hypothetical protein